MRPWNPYGRTFSGEPITSATPVGLVVMGPVPILTGAQRAMAQAAFVSFVNMARLSVAPNQQQHGLLPDGSPYQISVVGQAAKMLVWPIQYATSKENKYLSGLVFIEPGSAPGEGARHIIDVVTMTDGSHTLKWKSDRLTADEYRKLRISESSMRLRNSVKGPSGLPYSMDGATFGRVLFNPDLAGTGRYENLLAFEGTKSYTISEGPGPGTDRAIICTISQLSGPVGLDKPIPTAESSTSVLAVSPFRPDGYYDWSFNGKRIVAQVPNPKITPDYVIVDQYRTLFLENPGPNYSYPPVEYIDVPIPGKPYEGEARYQMYERTDDSFQLQDAMVLPPPEVVPPLAAYNLRTYFPGMPEPYRVYPFAGRVINTEYTGDDLFEESYSRTVVRFAVDGEYPWLGSWVTNTTAVLQRGGDCFAEYKHKRVYRPEPPKFGFGSSLYDCVVTDVYTYEITMDSSVRTELVGSQYGPTILSAEQDLYPPPTTGEPLWGGWFDYVRTSVGGTSSVEISTGTTTCTLAGRSQPFVMKKSSAHVTIATDTDVFMENADYGSEDSYARRNGNGTVESRLEAREIQLYDPYLDLLCYTEYESHIVYSVASTFDRAHAGRPNTVATATRSAGPSTQSLTVTGCRYVVELAGKVVLSLPLDSTAVREQIAEGHRIIPAFAFDSPAQSTVGAVSELAEVLPPTPSLVGLGVGIFTGFNAVAPNPPSLGGEIITRYTKAPATGAMVLQLSRTYGETPQTFVVDKLRFRPVEDLYESLPGLTGGIFQTQVV